VVELITVGGKEYFRTVPTNESPERVLSFIDAGSVAIEKVRLPP
jgi:hypothetical protein